MNQAMAVENIIEHLTYFAVLLLMIGSIPLLIGTVAFGMYILLNGCVIVVRSLSCVGAQTLF